LAVVKSTTKQLELLARLMHADAESEGQFGMLMVENVGVNRVRVNCLDFKDIRNLDEMVFQSPGGFEKTKKSYFDQLARKGEKKLAP
jgi:N-acetylmuramoyl-L-alanine amidase